MSNTLLKNLRVLDCLAHCSRHPNVASPIPEVGSDPLPAAHALLLQLRELRLVDVPLEVPLHLLQLLLEFVELLFLRDLVP